MFNTGSQRKYWMFDSAVELQQLRFEKNERYRRMKSSQMAEEPPKDFFLSPHEEFQLYRQFENILRDFCRKFQPPMPRGVVATAINYYKRYYLNNSVMDFHPKYILVTCVYLACKVEEFNVSMAQFVENVKGNREKAAGVILNNELLLMQQLKYHLTVHNPYRPIEGFLIHLKTHASSSLGDVERFRPEIESLLDLVLLTDAPLLYSPSQIALSLVVEAAHRNGATAIEEYVNSSLLNNDPTLISRFWDKKSAIMKLTTEVTNPAKETIRPIEKKLDKCRNQANDPDSAEFQRALAESGVGVETSQYVRLSQEQEQHELSQVTAHAQKRAASSSGSASGGGGGGDRSGQVK